MLFRSKKRPRLPKRRRRILRGTTLACRPLTGRGPSRPANTGRRNNARHTSALTHLSAGGSKGIFAAVPHRLAPNGGSLGRVPERLLVLIYARLFNYPYHTTFYWFVNRILSKISAPHSRFLTDTGTAAGCTGQWPPENTPSCEIPASEIPPPGERTPPAPPRDRKSVV